MDKPETVDHRADLYSLGVVIYEMLTGETPVGRFELPSQKAQVDVRFDEIVLHALEKEPARRYQHASEVKQDVENVTGMPQVAPVPKNDSPSLQAAAPVPVSQPVGSFLRAILWLAVLIGVVMFCWVEVVDVMTAEVFDPKAYVHTVRIGVVQPWLILLDDTAGHSFYRLNLATISALGGLGALVAGIALFCFRRRSAPDIRREVRAEAPQPPSPAASKRTRHLLSAFLVLLCLFGFFFGLSFQAKHSGSAAGPTKIITVGALDPLYVSESGPSGFQTGFHFFSWSFFAVVVSGVTFGALWRIGREDEGKVPRDPAWWRDWWKQVGVWGGLLLIVCIVRTVMNPKQVLQPPGERTVRASIARPPKRAANAPELSAAARLLESRIDAALAIAGDSTRNDTLRTLAIEAAGHGLLPQTQRALEKMSFVELKDNTAAKCARQFATYDPAAAMELAKLIAGTSLRELVLREAASPGSDRVSTKPESLTDPAK